MNLLCRRVATALSLAVLFSAAFTRADSLAEHTVFECRYCAVAAALAAPDSAEFRKYAPDRLVDILHQTLDVTPDFGKGTVSGQVTLTFKPIGKPLAELRLNGIDLAVSFVTCSEKLAGHQVTDKEVIVTFAKPVAVGKETKLTIRYSAEPVKGLYFRTPELGYRPEETHVWTQGEADEARHWFPCYDYPNEKFTTEMICHVPEGMTVLSNGRLVSTQKNAKTGLMTFRWLQEKPHVNYLITLIAGHYRTIEDQYKNIPLTFHTPPSDIAEAPNSFQGTKEMMAFFEEDIGVPYPWDKYGQAVVHDFHWGGMENTSLTTLTDRTLFQKDTENVFSSEGLVAHELAHQWFGDLVTCKDWSHIWLNEGFATYYTHLFMGHKYGRDHLLYGMFNDSRGITSQTNNLRAMVYRQYNDPKDMFNYLAYPKGSWILHMLRTQLGDELYRRCIKTYLDRHQYGVVVTEDLNAVIEELSGKSFDRFFDQWVYHAQQPELEVRYSWDQKTKLAKVSVKQIQKITDDVYLFQFPVTLRFKSKSGTVDQRVQVKEKEEDFYVSLKDAPEIVRFDPELSVLAKISFEVPNAMLYAQLADKSDMVGRLLAAEQLGSKRDRDSIGKLKEALNSDAFYGVRIKASESLRKIRTDEALDALLASTKQSDARVRNAVVNDLGQFHHERALAALKQIIASEKNPAIAATALRGLGAYTRPDVRELLGKSLNSTSYRQRLADAAIAAMKTQGDPSFIAPLLATLSARESQFTTVGFAAALDALASLARGEERRDAVREFLIRHTNHKKERIQLAAITALGTLDDPRAGTVLESFALSAKPSPQQEAAEKALNLLRGSAKRADNLRELRQEMLEIQKENRRLSRELEDLKKRVGAGEKK
ncbi:MAG: M1 family aminopeptidase [Verrucomicrobiota bacterium]